MFDRPGRLRLTEPPEAALALALSEWAGSRGSAGLLFVARSEARAEQLASAARCFASNDQEVLLLPPWDCLPFDRSSPSPAVMGHRIATLVRLGEPALAGGRLLIAPAEALVQRIAPSTVWPQAALTIQRDDVLRGEELRHFVLRAGYVLDERVDEPGEIAIRGQVIDLFPADAPHPYRIRLAPDDRVAAIQRYDPASQRTEAEVNRLVVWPASEVVLPDELIRRFIAAGEAGGNDEAATLERQRIRQVLAGSASEPRRVAALEHRLPRFYERLYSLFELLPHAAVVLDSEAEQRLDAWLDQIEDAYRRRCSLARVQPVVGGSEALPADAPERLYLRREELATALDMRSVLVVGAGGADALELAAAAVPNFADGRDAIVAVSAYIMEQRKAGQRVILCAGSDAERTKLARLVERRAGASAAQLHRWSEVAVTEPGSLASLVLELSAGFTAPGLTVLTSADVLGAPSPVAATGPAIGGGDAFATEALRPGDLVVHAQHGIGRLAGLERLDQDEIARECLSIDYAGGQKLLVPTDEIDTIWRYGSGDASLALDRLTGDGWATRRQEVEAQVAQVASSMPGRGPANRPRGWFHRAPLTTAS